MSFRILLVKSSAVMTSLAMVLLTTFTMAMPSKLKTLTLRRNMRPKRPQQACPKFHIGAFLWLVLTCAVQILYAVALLQV